MTQFFRAFSLSLIILFTTLIFQTNCGGKDSIVNNQKNIKQVNIIDEKIQNGDFSNAIKIINQLKTNPNTQQSTLISLRFKEDLMKRILIDFNRSEDYVRENLEKYYPELDQKMLTKWEKSKALEMRIIDGNKRYFRNAIPNLFRIDNAAKKNKEKIDGVKKNILAEFRLAHTNEILKEHKTEYKHRLNPKKILFKYYISVNPDVTPPGETIRCWMPFPREDNPRQQNVKLLKTNGKNYIIAPEKYHQRSIYMEKIAKTGQETRFEIEISYNSYAEYYDLENSKFEKYDLQNEVYIKNTSEKPPHIVFSHRIKKLTNSLLHGIYNPYEKVKKIYEYIDQNIPWASALEYSTLPNIPEYVLDNKHGDCGMQSLLLITMLRYAGIPAKWQSGWMMHPGHVNLHDWAEVYYPGIGWVPVDQSFSLQNTADNKLQYYYTSGIDSYRLIVNDDISSELFPQKIFPRSETVDFQRGEVEWRGGNIYFDKWDYHMEVKYLE